MWWFSDDVDASDKQEISNNVHISNTDELKVESDEILTVLIVIMLLLCVLVVLRLVSLIKKAARRETQRDNILLTDRRQV